MRDNPAAALSGEDKRSWRIRWFAVLVWSIFGIGLLVQAFSPGLRIEHGKFVAPAAMSYAKEIHPDEIIAQERRVQLLSVTLTVVGALGLAVRYGPALLRRRES
jgi:hypothetical protein